MCTAAWGTNAPVRPMCAYVCTYIAPHFILHAPSSAFVTLVAAIPSQLTSIVISHMHTTHRADNVVSPIEEDGERAMQPNLATKERRRRLMCVHHPSQRPRTKWRRNDDGCSVSRSGPRTREERRRQHYCCGVAEASNGRFCKCCSNLGIQKTERQKGSLQGLQQNCPSKDRIECYCDEMNVRWSSPFYFLLQRRIAQNTYATNLECPTAWESDTDNLIVGCDDEARASVTTCPLNSAKLNKCIRVGAIAMAGVPVLRMGNNDRQLQLPYIWCEAQQ